MSAIWPSRFCSTTYDAVVRRDELVQLLGERQRAQPEVAGLDAPLGCGADAATPRSAKSVVP